VARDLREHGILSQSAALASGARLIATGRMRDNKHVTRNFEARSTSVYFGGWTGRCCYRCKQCSLSLCYPFHVFHIVFFLSRLDKVVRSCANPPFCARRSRGTARCRLRHLRRNRQPPFELHAGYPLSPCLRPGPPEVSRSRAAGSQSQTAISSDVPYSTSSRSASPLCGCSSRAILWTVPAVVSIAPVCSVRK